MLHLLPGPPMLQLGKESLGSFAVTCLGQQSLLRDNHDMNVLFACASFCVFVVFAHICFQKLFLCMILKTDHYLESVHSVLL